jgi:hypothetical protein
LSKIQELYISGLTGSASAPNPSDSAADANSDTDLSWSAGYGATSHNVYFGTNPTPGPNEFRVNQTGTSYDPGTLAHDTTYYWRIDEVNPDDTITGPLWSFTTAQITTQQLWDFILNQWTNTIEDLLNDPNYATQKYPRAVDRNTGKWMPYGMGSGGWVNWAGGFVPGSLWYLYQKTGDQQWKDWAEDWTAGLANEPNRTKDHEAGFTVYRSFGLGYQLTV